MQISVTGHMSKISSNITLERGATIKKLAAARKQVSDIKKGCPAWL